jgi:uracil-DNA glycosylase
VNGKPHLAALVADIRRCRICADALEQGARPVLRISQTAQICIAGQAPGVRVHESGIPYDDRSGDRLRSWLAMEKHVFYDEKTIAIVPMGFCFPGYDAAGGDKAPRRECVAHWHDPLFGARAKFKLVLAIGTYAQAYHLKGRVKENMTETVRSWREYGSVIPLPHPSWHNNAWLKKNPWFETELLPFLRARVSDVLAS